MNETASNIRIAAILAVVVNALFLWALSSQYDWRLGGQQSVDGRATQQANR